MTADHCGFQVKSMDEAIRFYTQKLGFQLDHRAINQQEQEEYAFVSLGSARLELIQDLVNEYVVPPSANLSVLTTVWKCWIWRVL